jgi:23S rRNA (pseudouridine1915-N3)-methyltransferase
MFSITVICIGKLKEKFYMAASEEYLKRMKGYCDCKLLELPEVRLPEDPNDAQIAEGLRKEAEAIEKKIPKGAWFCCLTPEGKSLSSPQLAKTMADVKLSGKSSAVFLIGGSNGIDASLKKRADLLLSMSAMTFPHHLARVMVLEQLYRAETIQAGTKYHK